MKKMHPIEALIEQGEHQQLDFKFEVSDSKKIARTLSAFANTDGGRLLIGVKDNGNISGVRSEEEYYMIEAASKMYTRPEVPFEATRWEVNGKTVLEVYIAPSPDKPHTAPDKADVAIAPLLPSRFRERSLDMIHLLMAQTIEPMVEAHRVRPGEETGTEEAAAEAESAAAVENAENAEETV